MNFEKYVGIPYVEKGRDLNGLDCWGLVRLIYEEQYHITLPSFSDNYTYEDDERIAELVAQYREGWDSVTDPQEGDVVVLKMLGVEQHVGVMVNNTQFIHVRSNSNSAIESITSPKWSKRVGGFYKYSEATGVALAAIPHPLKTVAVTSFVVPGTNLEELFERVNREHQVPAELCKTANIMVNGVPVPRHLWATTVLKTTDTVEYRALAGKDVVRMVALITLAVVAGPLATKFAASAAASTLVTTFGVKAVTAFATAAITVAGSYLINAIAPIRPPSQPRDPGTSERQLMVNGGSNAGNPYGSIPVVLGKVRVTPPLGSVNYLTYESERDSYLSMLLVWGYGPLYLHPDTYRIGDLELNNTNFTNWEKVDDFRINELDSTNFTAFNRIYGKDVVQVNTQIELTCDGNPETSVSPGPPAYATTNEEYDPITNQPSPVLSATVAIHFPQGLRRIVIKGNGAGNSEATSVAFRIDVSTNIDNLGDEGSWSLLDSFSLGGDSPKRDAFTWTKTYSLNTNKVALRIRRETGDNTEDNDNYRYYFTSVLQNVTFTRNIRPVLDPVGSKIAKTALKIKATNQLNGTIQGISAVVQTWCKTWNGVAWVDGVTSNPAALMRYVLEHPANPRRITDAASQINLPQLQSFFNYCQSRGFEYNAVMGQARSVLEVIRDICAAGRGSPALIDGKWTVIIDEAKPNVIQHFTPHNSWGFEGTKALPKRPDGLRVTYYDQDREYQESEIIVYDIGKTSANSTLFESITLPGVTKKSLVIDHARWHMAQMKLRPEVYTLNCDIEYLVCNRGDRVKVTHDVPMWGLGSGRVKDRPLNNQNQVILTRVELDEEVPMVAGTQYTIRFRTKTGSSITRTVVSKTQDGYYSTIDLTQEISVAEADVGDLFLFGELNQESQDLLVLSIEPTTNNVARITLIDYGVTSGYNIFNDYQNLTASTVFESQITLPPVLQIDNFGTKVPQITGFVSDESVMERVSKGVYKYNINTAYFNAQELPNATALVQAEYDLNSATNTLNSRYVAVPAEKGSLNLSDVAEGETYKVRLRYVSKNGTTGPWSSYSTHTVVGKISPPSNVTQFTAAADKASGQVLLSWNQNPEPDVFTYEVRTQNFNWGIDDQSRVFYGDSNNCFVKPIGTTTYHIKAVDTAGNYSTSTTSVVYTQQVLPNIGQLRHSFADTALTNATVTLEWDEVPNSEFNVAYYEISYNSVTKTVKGSAVTIPADWVGERVFTIKTVDIQGTKSSGLVTSITKFAPNPPVNLKTQVIDNNVMLYWNLPARTSLPIDHVLIKKGASWNTATTVGEKKGEFTSISEIKGGDYTYWLVCVDTEGIESTPVGINTTVAEPPDFIFNGDFTSTLNGTRVNCAVDGGQLVLPVNTVESFENHFTTRGWNTPENQVNAGFPVYVQPSTATGSYEEVFDFQQPLASSRVTLNYIGTNISGTPTVKNTISVSLDGTNYINYTDVVQIYANSFRYVKIKIEVENTSTPQTDLYVISSIGVVLDAKLKDDVGTVLALSGDTNGTVVNFAKEFIDVQSITLAPNNTTPVYGVYEFKDVFATGIYSVASNVCTVTTNNTDTLNSITWSGTQFVAVGLTGRIITSSDGISWAIRTSGITDTLESITWSGTQFVAVGSSRRIITSPDGINWVSRLTGGASLNSVTWSGSQFVTVGGSGVILTSSEGITWTARTSGTTNSLNGITGTGSLFVTVGLNGTILTSTDGITWTARTSGTTNELSGITWSGTQFVTVGDNGTILTSTDGITWTTRTSGTSNPLRSVTWSGSQFVIVGFNGTILTSTDGITWTTRTSGTTNILRSVTWSGSQFVIVGNAGILLSSSNGTTWTTISNYHHGLTSGQKVKLFINSGTGIAGIYTVTGSTANNFTVNMTTANTSGSVSLYPQSFRVYVFNSSGTRVSSDLSWAVRGY